MWTLAEALDRLGNMIAEPSNTVFWSQSERTAAINDAQRFVAGVTRGVPYSTTVEGVTFSESDFTLGGDGQPAPLSEYGISGYSTTTGRSLATISEQEATLLSPLWRNHRGIVRWLVIRSEKDTTDATYITASPASELQAEDLYIQYRALPRDLALEGDRLFENVASMEKYQTPVLFIATAYLLLKERYDGDAERFYQMGLTEMQSLGALTERVPKSIVDTQPGGQA